MKKTIEKDSACDQLHLSQSMVLKFAKKHLVHWGNYFSELKNKRMKDFEVLGLNITVPY